MATRKSMARMMDIKKKANSKVQSLSFWTEPVTDDVAFPTVHLIALIVYAVGLSIYAVYAALDWTQFERPALFESQETSSFDVVPLNFTIDCQDCRRNLFRHGSSGELWRLSWDYTHLAEGCAARSPHLFDSALSDFCAAQNDPATVEYYDVAFATCANVFSVLVPFSPGVPYGVTPTMEECEFRCTHTAGCSGYNYAMANFTQTPIPGVSIDFPRGTCVLMSSAAYDGCTWFNPTPTAEVPVLARLQVQPPTGPPPANPLDKCTISSEDVAMFHQSGSPDPLVASAAHVPYRRGWGWNANYLGSRPTSSYENLSEDSDGFYFGPASPGRGKGSFFDLRYNVPLCFGGDDNTDVTRGLSLEIQSIPHHAFADPRQIGQAMVTISSGSTFRQQNRFQPWHKNTLHLGLTVHKDEGGGIVSSDPFFTNFQYDGRVDFGREEGLLLHGLAAQQQSLTVLLGDDYNGLELRDAVALDAILDGGSVTPLQIVNWTLAEFEEAKARIGDAQIGRFVEEYLWRAAIDGAMNDGRGNNDPYYGSAPAVPTGHGQPQRRKLTAAMQRLQVMRERVRAMREAATGESAGGVRVVESASGRDEDDEGPAATGAGHRRRLNDHDSWGGVQLSLRLSRFANVYTAGHKPGWYDVVAGVGGASGSLIGLLGMGILLTEIGLSSIRSLEQCCCSSSSAAPGKSVITGGPAATSSVGVEMDVQPVPMNEV